LYWQQGLGGEAKVLLDPNTLASDGTVALQSIAVTDDGKLLAYSLSEAGSDLEKIHVRSVATGQDLPDVVEWVKFSGISWLKNGSGFFYSSYGVPTTEDERAAALKSVGAYHKVYFHKLGTSQTEDRVIFERHDDKEMLSNVGVSDDGHWLVIHQSKGDKNALWVKDLSQHGWESPTAPVIKIAAVDDAVYDWIENDGRAVWMRTTKDAPNGKIVRLELDFTHPERPVATPWNRQLPGGCTERRGTVHAGRQAD
jgi:prolyl oligopeptidase